jgi:hypothetical protein
MNYPPRPEHRQQRVGPIDYDHAALTATLAVKLFKALGPFAVQRVTYNNPTGLAQHADNWFRVEVKKLTALVVADFVFTAADTNICTKVAHGLATGDGPVRVSNAGGALPAGLAAATDYWVIRLDADTFSLATTLTLALIGTAVDITDAGTGTQTLSDTADTVTLVTIATGVDTDSDLAGTNTLAANVPVVMTISSTARLVDAGEELVVVFTEGGTATLPAGRLVVEGSYL